LSLEEIQDLFEARSSGSKPPAATGRYRLQDGDHEADTRVGPSESVSRAPESSSELG